MSFTDILRSLFKDRKERYTGSAQDSLDWIDSNKDKIKALFSDGSVKEFVFEPFMGVINSPSNSIDKDIYSIITKVAIVNCVLAGLPGQLGIGVFVAMAMEIWMGYEIAKHVGIKIDKPSDVWKYFGTLAALIGGALLAFKTLLGFAFSLFALISPVNPLIPAELFVTDFVGILLWQGFYLVSKGGNFKDVGLGKSTKVTIGLFKHQWGLLKNVLNKENIKKVGKRLKCFLTGDMTLDPKTVRLENGEMLSTVAMAYLLSGHYDKLQGPLGEVFLEAIRLRWSAQFSEDASVEEIAERFREYSPDQIDGVINTVKGKMFEILVTQEENLDGDQWTAKMHTDESFPGSDITFRNSHTGEEVEVSLKAVSESNPQIIEEALARYPDIPIMATDEVAELFADDPRVFGSSVLNVNLENITNERFEELVETIRPINQTEVIVGGITVGIMTALWPFVMGYLRGFITKTQLEMVFVKVLGSGAKKLVSRLLWGAILGPVFAWYLLARGVKSTVEVAESIGEVEVTDKYYLEFKACSR